jgi:hypothetical protein
MTDGEDYRKLHAGQLTREYEANKYSAGVVLDILSEYLPDMKTMLDVGCGMGAWMDAATQRGITPTGIEGEWAKEEGVSHHEFDLSQPFNLNRKFDLVTCIEVAEHIPPDCADTLIDSLCRHGDVIVFSAAIPFQGGVNHVNERFLGYWREKFLKRGYLFCDIFRSSLWEKNDILWWLRQNCVAFVHYPLYRTNTRLRTCWGDPPTDIIHPGVYLQRCREVEQLQKQVEIYQEAFETLKAQYGIRVEFVNEKKGEENDDTSAEREGTGG